MVTISALWLPILVASVFVFFASFVMHTVLPFHKKDWGKLGKEDDVMEALRGMDVQPGQYVFPHMTDPAQLKDEAFLAKMTRGPVAFLTVIPSGPPNMGKALGLYFVYCLVINGAVAYLTGRTLSADADYLAVLRVAGTAAFLAYSGALAPAAIWKGASWRATWLEIGDGLVYSLLIAGAFGWLWP